MPDENKTAIQRVKLARWVFLNKPLFRRVLIIALIIIGVVVWTVALYHFISLLLNQKAYQEAIDRLGEDLVNWQFFQERSKPTSPIISNITAIYVGQDFSEPTKSRYDLIAEIENPNDSWAINSLEGKFIFDGQNVSTATSLMPKEKKYLFSLNQITDSKIQSVDMEAANIKWQRIKSEMRQKLDILNQFIFKEINFIPPGIIDQKITPGRIQFKALNSSAYNFWQINIQIIVYQGSKIVSIDPLPIKNWLAGQEQSLEINLTKSINSFSSIKIVPDVNILDGTVFMQP